METKHHQPKYVNLVYPGGVAMGHQRRRIFCSRGKAIPRPSLQGMLRAKEPGCGYRLVGEDGRGITMGKVFKNGQTMLN